MPDGSDVPALELVAPSPGYDPLRSTFAIWIERWLTDLGGPHPGKSGRIQRHRRHPVQRHRGRRSRHVDLGLESHHLPRLLGSLLPQPARAGNEEGGSNWGGYSNPEFDQMAFELLSETDIDGARDKVLQMQEFLAEELPYVTLFTIPKLDAYRPSRIEFPYTSVLGGLEGQGGMQQAALIK